LTYGDGVADVNIKRLVDFHVSHKKIATVTGVKPLARFGLLSVEGDTVIDFSEKPQMKEGYINGGFFVLNQKVFEYIDEGDGCIFEREPVQRLSRDGELMLFHHDGYWHCMDTIRDMRSLEEEWQKERPAWKIWG
jgi:glucose-1-phosphate cytidylyltransferase